MGLMLKILVLGSAIASLLYWTYRQEPRFGLKKGYYAPHLAARDSSGKVRQLASLRGRYVLVNFWASWCPNCRAENHLLREIYAENQHRRFEIFSVSLDGSDDADKEEARAQWINAIQMDGLNWPFHVSDLRGWDSPIVNKYNIKGIPMTYLIDPKGKIIAKGLRGRKLKRAVELCFEYSGPALTHVLSELEKIPDEE